MNLDHCFRTLVAALWMTAVASPAVGQVDTSPSPDTVQGLPQGAAVVVRGDTLFRLYGSMGPFTPADRASALMVRIDSLARAPGARSTAVDVVDTTGASELRVGRRPCCSGFSRRILWGRPGPGPRWPRSMPSGWKPPSKDAAAT
jgi:hypothetical protein